MSFLRLRALLAPLAGVAVFALPALARAGGFYVPEIGPKGTAMAGAAAGQQLDTTNIVHNPAGLAGQSGHNVQVAGTLVFPNVEFFRRPVDDPVTGDAIRFDRVQNTNKVGAIPYLGYVTDAGVKNLAVGVGVFVPFGAHIAYPKDGAQRHIVTEVEFRTIYVAPTVAYKFADRLSIGAGLNYIYSDISIGQVNALQFVIGDPEANPNPAANFEGDTLLEGRDAASFSGNVGVLYTDPEGRFGIGASVMTPTRLKFKGEATIENPMIAPLLDEDDDAIQGEGGRTDTFSLEYPLPLIVRLGTMVRPIRQLTIAADINWQRWKTFEKLVVDFDNNYELAQTPGAFMADVVIDNHWRNTLTARLGFDAMPVPDPERIPLHVRAGVLFDQGAVPDRYFDVLAPDSDKLGISAGLGYSFPLGSERVWMDIDIAYMHLFFKERNIAPVDIGPDDLDGNDDDDLGTNDTIPNPQQETIPGSNKTIVNKPAPSFFHGVTRASFDMLGLGIAIRVL
jgi:long-chain fatty acid transport protein